MRLAFRNALAIEIRHLLDEVMIVENDRAVAPDRQRMFVALNADAGVGGGGGTVFLLIVTDLSNS